MPSAEYDAALLDAAPKVDKQAIREGYSIDILAQTDKQPLVTPSRPASTAPPPAAAPQRRESEPKDLEANAPLKSKSSQPFWKTRKGILIIGAVVIAVIVAAVVGGVVGGRKKGGDDGELGQDGGQEEGGAPATSTAGEQQGGPANPTQTTDSISLPSITSLPGGGGTGTGDPPTVPDNTPDTGIGGGDSDGGAPGAGQELEIPGGLSHEVSKAFSENDAGRA